MFRLIAYTKPVTAAYRPDIDGLRAIAILSVVTFHAFPAYFRGGFVGVDMFFVISGFLITSLIVKNLKSDDFSFIDFYQRRIRRIFPALVLVLTACFLFGSAVLYSGENQQLGKHILGGASFISNLMLWSENGYFDNSADTKPLLHLWSLAGHAMGRLQAAPEPDWAYSGRRRSILHSKSDGGDLQLGRCLLFSSDPPLGVAGWCASG